MNLQRVDAHECRAFVRRWHYSDVFPVHTPVCLAAFDASGMAACAMWGWGTRPLHTIRKLFPSLTTADYYELGKLCARDELPRNTESQFLSACADWFRREIPKVKLLFTWADGIRGKPGYVYQASGWLYGGFITTETYVSATGEAVHPRLLITRYGKRDRATTAALGLRKVWGRQFRYVRFLCSHGERKRLLRESTVRWGQPYPKSDELQWKVQVAGEASREMREPPRFERSGQFRHPAPLFDTVQEGA